MSQVFFREAAYNVLRTKIDDEFLRRVSLLQTWFRARHHRKQFLLKRAAVSVLQVMFVHNTMFKISNSERYVLRINKNKLWVAQRDTNSMKRSFGYVAAKVWNEIINQV